jgi:uncharacterized protein YcbK (DUF882 family)
MQLTENFALSEFACKDGTQVPDNLICNVQTLAENLQILRDFLGEPVRLNSGYRTQKYNARIGGAPKSQHLLAKAADITVKSKTPKQVKATIEKLIKAGKMKDGGIGLYAGFVHYDVGPVRRW